MITLGNRTFTGGDLDAHIGVLEAICTTENNSGMVRGARNRARKLLAKYALTQIQREKLEMVVKQAEIRITTRPLTQADYQEAWHAE